MPRTNVRSSDRIFVSIASYRDAQLVPTIADCLAKAAHPERLRFGICWQHDVGDDLPDWMSGEQFRVQSMDWRDSRGTCWARAQVMQLWDGEEWFLQLDSHHRFVPDWDTLAQEQLERTGSGKHLLTTYAPNFEPHRGEPSAPHLTSTGFDSFRRDGLPRLAGKRIPSSEQTGSPRRARFIAAHFLFAPSAFIEDVPYDPELYFQGEEINLSARAFTHGYDFFEPAQPLLWHHYRRHGERRHWDDHIGDSGTSVATELSSVSRRKVLDLLSGRITGRFGPGSIRTLAEFEAFIGIDFENRRVDERTRRNIEPLWPPATPDWADSFGGDRRHPTRRNLVRWTRVDTDHVAQFDDTEDHYTLNETGRVLINLADGSRTMTEIAQIFQARYTLTGDPIADVTEFYDDAVQAGLAFIWNPDAAGYIPHEA